jgi:hypothetical protein
LDQIDEYVPDVDYMLPTNIIEDKDRYYSYDDFGFFDTREENERHIRWNSAWKSYFQICIRINDNSAGTGGYCGLVGRANIGNREI